MCYSPEYNRYLRHIPASFLDHDGEFLVVTMNEKTTDDHSATTDGRGSNTRTMVSSGLVDFSPSTAQKSPGPLFVERSIQTIRRLTFGAWQYFRRSNRMVWEPYL